MTSSKIFGGLLCAGDRLSKPAHIGLSDELQRLQHIAVVVVLIEIQLKAGIPVMICQS